MNKEIEELNSHCKGVARGDLSRDCVTSFAMTSENGRTMLEMLATLAVMGLLAVGVVKIYKHFVNNVKAQNTAKQIQTLAFERQNFAMAEGTASRRKVKGPHGDLYIENGTPGNHSKYFWVETTLSDKDFCERLKESGLIQADLIEVDDVINGNCTDHSKLAFYFKKNTSSDENLTWVDGEGNVHPCPTGSSACDNEGNATACEAGYYLDGWECSTCGEHVATCEDEETPLTCMEGYELHWGECILPPQTCTTDLQCTACGECDTETGYCQSDCEIPRNRCYSDNDCGMNECMVCNTTSHSCEYACERKSYLEQTSYQQYINTNYKSSDSTTFQIGIMPMSNTTRIFGGRKGENPAMVATFSNVSNVKLFLDYGSGGNLNRIQGANWTKNIKYNLEFGNRYIKNLDSNTNMISSSSVSFNQITIPLYLLGLNENGQLGTTVTDLRAKLYYFKTYDNDELVRDFVPVSSPKGNCMFDRVSEKLFCNAGTGEFLTD